MNAIATTLDELLRTHDEDDHLTHPFWD